MISWGVSHIECFSQLEPERSCPPPLLKPNPSSSSLTPLKTLPFLTKHYLYAHTALTILTNMTFTKKLTLFYTLFLSSSLVLSKPIPADETSLLFEPPTSMLTNPEPTATPAPAPDGVTFSDVPTQAADSVASLPSDTPVAQVQPSPTIAETPINVSPATPSPTLVENDIQDTYTAPQATPTFTPAQDDDVRLSAESHAPQPPAYQDSATLFTDTSAPSPDPTPFPTVVDESALESQTVISDSASTIVSHTTYYASSTSQATASYLTRSVFDAPSPSKPAAPMPTNKDQSISPATEASRRFAIAGTFLAICIVVSLVGCFLCMRCRRSAAANRKAKAPSQQYIEDQEKGSISSEKVLDSPSSKSDSIDGMTLPVLPSDAPGNVSPLTQDRWRYLATNEVGQYQDVTHVLVGGPYSEISLESNADIHSSAGSVGGQSTEDAVVIGNRTSAGATSTTQSYSTCASRYSAQSTDAQHQTTLDDIDFLPTFLCPPPPVVKQGRARSKTVTSSTGSYPSTLALIASSKSFPTKLSSTTSTSRVDSSRLSAESGRSGVTKRSTGTGSEWDVAREYGRFSKESIGGSSILSTITEDPEHVEAVDIGKKSCLLVTGKF